MIAPNYAVHLRRHRLDCVAGAAFVLLALGAVVVGVAKVILSPIIAGLVAAILVVVSGFMLGPGLRARPARTQVIFDRRVESPPSPAQRASPGTVLTFSGAEFDQLSVAAGARPLSTFLQFGGIRAGMATEPASAGLAAVEALLGKLRSEPAPNSEWVDALEGVRAQLGAGTAAGARFCFFPIDVWTPLAEENLGLFMAR